jgi:hypothetical protein
MNTCPNCGKVSGFHSSILQGCMCQYSAPPQRTWAGLTDEEVKHEWEVWRANVPRYAGFAVGIEAKLKEKNT